MADKCMRCGAEAEERVIGGSACSPCFYEWESDLSMGCFADWARANPVAEARASGARLASDTLRPPETFVGFYEDAIYAVNCMRDAFAGMENFKQLYVKERAAHEATKRELQGERDFARGEAFGLRAEVERLKVAEKAAVDTCEEHHQHAKKLEAEVERLSQLNAGLTRDAAAERERANEWLAQKTDAEKEVERLRNEVASLEYVAGYESDLLAIRKALDAVDAPHDCEEGVSFETARIRLLGEQRDNLRAEAERLTKERDEALSLRDAAFASRDNWKAEAERLEKLFDDAGQGEYNVLALIEHYQTESMKADEEVERLRGELETARQPAPPVPKDVEALMWKAEGKYVGHPFKNGNGRESFPIANPIACERLADAINDAIRAAVAITRAEMNRPVEPPRAKRWAWKFASGHVAKLKAYVTEEEARSLAAELELDATVIEVSE